MNIIYDNTTLHQSEVISKFTSMNIPPIIFCIIMAMLVWGAWANHAAEWAIWWTKDATDVQMTRAGQWGDSFGVLNALVSSLAFTIVLFTLILQARALRDQTSDLHRQRFESSFFELLRLMRELREQVKFSCSIAMVDERGKTLSTENAKKLKERLREKKSDLEAFDSIIIEYAHWYSKNKDEIKSSSEEELKRYMAKIYDEKIHLICESTISPYFRIIYSILSRIKNDKILKYDEKIQYGNLLRRQITSREMTVLAINATSEVFKDMFSYLCHFKMLKYLPKNPTRKTFEEIYPVEAFSSRD